MRDSMETYATTGAFTNAWNGWYALGHYALWSEIAYEPARDRSLALSDTMIAEDGDGDGGIPARPADTDTMDQTWVTSYLAFMGLDPWIAAGTDVPPHADGGARIEPMIVRAAPNPFRGATTIYTSRPASTIGTVRIYDLSGRLVRNFDGVRAQGSFEPAAEWDGRDENGREVAPGLYVIRVESSNGAGTAKISLVR
jgi:hypothetical protein